METQPIGISNQSRKYNKVQNIMRYVNEKSLTRAHIKQSSRKAVGVDGVGKEEYAANLQENIAALVDRMKKMQYRPQPVRRTYIPKTNGKLRPLGIPAYEDKLVQYVMAEILSEIYEERFLDCSYGFRPKRKAHDVVKYISDTIMHKKVNYVLEADIKGFFDNVDHEWMMKFLENDIDDTVFLRYIKRFLIAGVMEEAEFQESDRGTPQGGLISPVCANVYLHYVLDLWFEKAIIPRLKGEAYYIRYADDFLVMFQYETDAEAVLNVLRKRLSKFSLEVAEEKTRILPIGRYKGTKENFDFLGFTFYNCKTQKGYYRVGVRTSKKKLQAKKQAAKKWISEQKTQPIDKTLKTLAKVMRGHCNYYGVSGNSKDIRTYHLYLIATTYKMLKRRSQRSKLTWAKFSQIWREYVTPPRICVNIW